MTTELVKIPCYVHSQSTSFRGRVGVMIFPEQILRYGGYVSLNMDDIPSCPPVGSKVTITITYEEET